MVITHFRRSWKVPTICISSCGWYRSNNYSATGIPTSSVHYDIWQTSILANITLVTRCEIYLMALCRIITMRSVWHCIPSWAWCVSQAENSTNHIIPGNIWQWPATGSPSATGVRSQSKSSLSVYATGARKPLLYINSSCLDFHLAIHYFLQNGCTWAHLAGGKRWMAGSTSR